MLWTIWDERFRVKRIAMFFAFFTFYPFYDDRRSETCHPLIVWSGEALESYVHSQFSEQKNKNRQKKAAKNVRWTEISLENETRVYNSSQDIKSFLARQKKMKIYERKTDKNHSFGLRLVTPD